MNIEKSVSGFRFLENVITKLTINNSSLSLENENVLSREIDMDYRIIDISSEDDSYYGILELTISPTIKTKSKLHNKRKSEFKAVIQTVGYFSGSIKIGEEKFREMLSINGTSTLYSIVRGILTSISGMSVASGMLKIPMINVHAFIEAKKREESDALSK